MRVGCPSGLSTSEILQVSCFPYSGFDPSRARGLWRLPRPRTARGHLRGPAGSGLPTRGRDGTGRASPAPRRRDPLSVAGPLRLLSSRRLGRLPGAGPCRRAPPGRGWRTCGWVGIPGAGGGAPGSARGLAGARRGRGSTARTAAGCSHRWAAAAARARLSRVGVPETPAVTPGASQSRDRTRPRLRRSRPFSPLPWLLWLQPHLGPGAQVTSLPRSFLARGGARGPPTSSRFVGAGEALPVRGWSGEARLEKLGGTTTPSAVRAPAPPPHTPHEPGPWFPCSRTRPPAQR